MEESLKVQRSVNSLKTNVVIAYMTFGKRKSTYVEMPLCFDIEISAS
jgi:hypothetical protein